MTSRTQRTTWFKPKQSRLRMQKDRAAKRSCTSWVTKSCWVHSTGVEILSKKAVIVRLNFFLDGTDHTQSPRLTLKPPHTPSTTIALTHTMLPNWNYTTETTQYYSLTVNCQSLALFWHQMECKNTKLNKFLTCNLVDVGIGTSSDGLATAQRMTNGYQEGCWKTARPLIDGSNLVATGQPLDSSFPEVLNFSLRF